MSLNSRPQLVSTLRDKKYRDSFVSSQVSNRLAFQIRALRQDHEWSQAQLAARIGTSQNAVSRLENPRYGKASISTLKRIASVFDVALVVGFIPFSELVDWVVNLSQQSLIVPSFDDDLGLVERKAVEMEETIPASLRAKVSGDDRPRGAIMASRELLLGTQSTEKLIAFPIGGNNPVMPQERVSHEAISNLHR